MKELVETGGKRMTLKEVADATGAAYSTVAAYAQKAGWTENGKMTLLNESQVTVILEAMKAKETGGSFHKREAGDTFHNEIEGMKTSQSRAVRIAVLAKRQHEIDRQIQAEMQAEISELRAENTRLEAAYGREVLDHRAAQSLLAERETGLSIIQRIAEAGGLMQSDRDDVLALYGRKEA